jgi:hypothetical protein
MMKQAAIGVRVHSGWGAVVAVSGYDAGMPEIVERKHIIVIDPTAAGMKQPYHFAESMTIQAAEKHLSKCAAVSGRLALAAVSEMLQELRRRDYKVSGCALLLASGRTLPLLPDILTSHALIHTAEGEFFRQIFRDAFEQLRVRVSGFRERALEEDAPTFFGNAAPQVLQRIASLGRAVGPPWTQDEKAATLAAWMLLSGKVPPSE